MELSLIKRKEAPLADFAFADIRDTYAEMQAAQQEIGGTVTFRAKIPAGGGRMFEVDTGDTEPDYTDKLVGVVIADHKCNARFAEGTTGEPPVCSAIDGKQGLDTETGESRNCDGCPYNEYGTDAKGRGKACKNMVRVYLMTADSPIPVVISLPPTSIREWQRYRLCTLAARNLRPEAVLTELSIRQAVSKGGDKYGIVVPKMAGRLSDEAAETARFFADALRPMTEVTADDYRAVGTEAKEDDSDARK